MIIVRPQAAALAIGSSCKRYDGSDSPVLLELLRDLTPRIENALNVRSLSRASWTETFMSPQTGYGKASLFLDNAFIVPGTAVIEGVSASEGEMLSAPALINEEKGTVQFDGYSFAAETFSVTYSSGFEIEPAPVDPAVEGAAHADINYRCLVDVPDWLRSIVNALLVKHFRGKILSPQGIPKGVSLFGLSSILDGEISSLVYSRYMRPRYGLQSAAKIVRNV